MQSTSRLLYFAPMRNRFYFDGLLVPGSEVELAGEEFHHAVRVHRTRVGEEVELFDGRGGAAAAVVRAIDRSAARLELGDRVDSREPRLAITLGVALIHPEKFELVLQKATELGVSELVPMQTDLSEIRPERVAGRRERWQKIILEAVKQSGRSRLPILSPPLTADAVMKRSGTKLFLEAGEADGPPASASDAVVVLVGPEGGWSEREVALARTAGCHFTPLGVRRLRAETAAIAAVAVVAREAGELGWNERPHPWKKW